MLKHVRIPSELAGKLGTVLRESQTDKEKFVRTSMVLLQQQQMLLRSKLDRVHEDRLSDAIPEELWNSKSAALQDELRRVRTEMERHEVASQADQTAGLQILELAQTGSETGDWLAAEDPGFRNRAAEDCPLSSQRHHPPCGRLSFSSQMESLMSPEGIVREFELPFRTDPQILALDRPPSAAQRRADSPTSSVVKAASSIPAADRARPSAATGSFGPSVVSRNVPKCMPMLRRAPTSICACTASSGFM